MGTAGKDGLPGLRGPAGKMVNLIFVGLHSIVTRKL